MDLSPRNILLTLDPSPAQCEPMTHASHSWQQDRAMHPFQHHRVLNAERKD
jgi:hypothetical protein